MAGIIQDKDYYEREITPTFTMALAMSAALARIKGISC